MRICLCTALVWIFSAAFVLPLSAQKVGLVLSGGGAKGIAHIGVLKALEENGIPIDYIAGTSMGGMVGGFYAAGYSPEDIEYIATSTDFQNWINGRFDSDFRYFFGKKPESPSFLSARLAVDTAFRTRLRTTIATDIPMNFALLELLAQPTASANFDFDSLFVPFRCMVADIFSQNAIVLREGSLSDALRGTVSVPFFYRPIRIDGKYVFDGGLYNNFPADVMREEFGPDVMIGSNTSSKVYNEYPEGVDEELLSRMTVFLFLSKSDSTQLGKNGIFINPDLNNYSATDFTPVQTLIQAGYESTMKQMPRIKEQIARRVSRDSLQARRVAFNNKLPPVRFDNIRIEGVSEEQRRYIRNIFHQDSKGSLSLKDIKNGYYRLVADDNFESVYPRMTYDSLSNTYGFELVVRPEKDFQVDFGGNVSSRPISNAYLGIQYNVFRKSSYTLGASFYSGRFYEAARLMGRMDVPWRTPFFLELDFIYNHWNYFRTSEIFIEDLKPTNIDQNDRRLELALGLPGRSNGRYILSAATIQHTNKYYLEEGVVSGPLDISVFDGYKFKLGFERNTLNRKQYASAGHRVRLGLYAFLGREEFEGSGAQLREEDRDWMMAKLGYEGYFKTSGFSKLGYLFEAVWSNQPYFSNLKVMQMMSPAFYPLPDSKSLFLENLRAPQYAALGLKNIVSFHENFDLRLEGYLFKPYKRLAERAEYEESDFDIRDFSLLGSAALVYHSPLGPVGLNLNYYDNPGRKVGVLFHIGYLIYNKRANE